MVGVVAGTQVEVEATKDQEEEGEFSVVAVIQQGDGGDEADSVRQIHHLGRCSSDAPCCTVIKRCSGT